MLLGVVKHSKTFVYNAQQCFALHLKQNFQPIIWIFNEVEGDGIESRLPVRIFSSLHIFHFISNFISFEIFRNGAIWLAIKRKLKHIFLIFLRSYFACTFNFILNLITFFRYLEMEQLDWQNKITEPIKGMLVTHPGMHPGAMRVDQLDRKQDDKNVIKYPEIVT